MNYDGFKDITLIDSRNEEKPAMAPFFSIGVPTYNRHELLKQTILSILGQTFTDFEIIIGNDYTNELLSPEILGITDPRIRIVNHSQNLGELGNMKSLLEISHGRYFTWQFDDDLYAPDFLEAVYSSLIKYEFPSCVYTSYGYIWGTSFPNIGKSSNWDRKLFSGKQFLRLALSGKLKVVGCCGVFNKEHLNKIGGVESLSESAIGAHYEHLLIVRTGMLENIAYVSSPLVLYRVHENSWSCYNNEADLYKQAGRKLIQKSIEVFMRHELIDDFRHNLLLILNLSLKIVIGKLIARDGYLNKQEMKAYCTSIKEQFNSLKGCVQYQIALSVMSEAEEKRMFWPVTKARLKYSMPYDLVKFAQMIRAFVSRYKFRV